MNYVHIARHTGRAIFDAGLQAKAEAHAAAAARAAADDAAAGADTAEDAAEAGARRTQPPDAGGSHIPVLDAITCVFEIRILLSFV